MKRIGDMDTVVEKVGDSAPDAAQRAIRFQRASQFQRSGGQGIVIARGHLDPGLIWPK